MKPLLMTAMAAVGGVALFASAIAQTESVIWNFDANSYPYAALTLDRKSGTLYGTATDVAANGTVFSLVEKRGVWKYHAIYTFAGGNDGQYPYGGVAEDSTGALYGTTAFGGESGYGTAFKLTFNGKSWVHTVLHSFAGNADGANPFGDLNIDPKTGAVYGTTDGGGPQICGTVFELPPSGGETVLYAFKGLNYKDGCGPTVRVREDSDGTLYGITAYGGISNPAIAPGHGVVYRLKQSHGVWNESVLYIFAGAADGDSPNDLQLDTKTGILYGTTIAGGNNNSLGTVFDLISTKSGWQENVLYDFQGPPDGEEPQGLHFDPKTGALTGTTFYGGGHSGGMDFQLTNNGGAWTETNLHSFTGRPADGLFPAARPTEDAKTGYLYGTTTEGGTTDGGVAYEIKP